MHTGSSLSDPDSSDDLSGIASEGPAPEPSAVFSGPHEASGESVDRDPGELKDQLAHQEGAAPGLLLADFPAAADRDGDSAQCRPIVASTEELSPESSDEPPGAASDAARDGRGYLRRRRATAFAPTCA